MRTTGGTIPPPPDPDDDTVHVVVSPGRPDTLRGAVPIPDGPIRHRLTPDQLLTTRGSARISPIQLTPEPQPVRAELRTPGGARTHGVTGYGRGCRCDTCRQAKIEADERYRARTRPGKILDLPTHGAAGYRRGCRCAECKLARAEARRAYTAGRHQREANQ